MRTSDLVLQSNMTVAKKRIVKKQLPTKEEHLRTLLYSLDEVLYGKKVGLKKRSEILDVLCTIYMSEDAELSRKNYRILNEYLTKDSSLIKVKRTFPGFAVSPDIFGEILEQYPNLVGLFLSVLYLSNLQTNSDLCDDIVELGSVLEKLNVVNRLNKCFKHIQLKEQILPYQLVELQILRNMANNFSLAGTFTTLPMVTVGLVANSKEYKDIIAAINRFPVSEELSSMFQYNTKRMRLLLSDISDIFLDYSIGEIRKKGLVTFPKLCRKFVTA